MRATVGGVECAILDISASGVRLLKPERDLPTQPEYDLVFEVEDADAARAYRVVGTLLRSTDISFVLGYRMPPEANWEAVIRSHDFIAAITAVDLGL